MTTTTNAHTKGTFRNLSVDLGSKHARPALEVLLKMEKRRNKVRSARVFSKSGYIHSANSSTSGSGSAIADIFDLLSRLPNLKQLTVDFHHYLPLQALCSLSQSPRLKALELHHVQLTGELRVKDRPQEPLTDEGLGFTISPLVTQVLSPSSSLQELSLLHCRGAPALQTLLQTGLPSSLKKLTVSNTPIGTSIESIGSTLAQWNDLNSLKLFDVPNLTDAHIQALAYYTLPHLQELEFTSNILGATAGRILIQSLSSHTPLQAANSKLELLKLHIDWEDCGTTVAPMLQTNHKLKQLDLRLYGDDDTVREDAILIARALQRTRGGLKRLRLCLEMEPTEADQAILDAFEQTLQQNETLKYLELDDSIEDYPLPLALQSKLKLNRSGAPQLWKRNCAATQEQFVHALISQRHDLNTLFHILKEEPTLCSYTGVDPGMSNSSSSSCAEECVSLDEDYHPVKPHSLFPHKEATSDNKKTKTRRFFRTPRRVMKSVFATSA